MRIIKSSERQDESGDLEINYIERETQKEEYAALYKAIKQLRPRQQEMIKIVYFEGKKQEEIAQKLGIDGSSVRHAMQRIYTALRKKYKNFFKNRHVLKSRVLGIVKGNERSSSKEEAECN